MSVFSSFNSQNQPSTTIEPNKKTLPLSPPPQTEQLREVVGCFAQAPWLRCFAPQGGFLIGEISIWARKIKAKRYVGRQLESASNIRTLQQKRGELLFFFPPLRRKKRGVCLLHVKTPWMPVDFGWIYPVGMKKLVIYGQITCSITMHLYTFDSPKMGKNMTPEQKNLKQNPRSKML